MSEVVDFLKYKNKIKEEEVADEDDFIIDTAITAGYEIIDYLYECGYDVRDNANTIYDIITIIEAIKCLMKTTRGEEYPLHIVAKEIFTVDDASKTLEEFLEDG